jgi:hypothetical protein
MEASPLRPRSAPYLLFLGTLTGIPVSRPRILVFPVFVFPVVL